jgi:hypothetical protein
VTAQLIVGVLRANAARPSASTAITPPCPPVRVAIARRRSVAACASPPRPRRRVASSERRAAKTLRMKASPWPVVETAQPASSAYVPAPISGESPTRPRRLSTVPPVLVAAAT